jgi:hypothetical protein
MTEDEGYFDEGEAWAACADQPQKKLALIVRKARRSWG